MDIDQIRKSWTRSADEDMTASIDLWNSAAPRYRDKEVPDWKSNAFLKLLADTIPITADMSSLDIGCGAGDYSIALAEKVRRSVGIDLSPDMIRSANEKASGRRTGKVEFICGDWNAIDIQKEGFENAFDIVFAHMTPAICSAETFEKMIACSKKHCALAKPTRRTDPVLEEMKRLSGLEGQKTGSDEAIPYIFAMLWQLGFCPGIHYRDEAWTVERNMEDACAWYIGKVKTWKRLQATEEESLKAYLRSIAAGGLITERITTTVVTVIWEKK